MKTGIWLCMGGESTVTSVCKVYYFFSLELFQHNFITKQIIKGKGALVTFAMQWSRHSNSLPSFFFFFWDSHQVLSQKTLLY